MFLNYLIGFEPEKYQQAKNLTVNGWYTQLVLRKSTLLNAKQLCKTALQEMRDSPILDLSDESPYLAWFYGGAQNRLKINKPDDMVGVHRLTIREHLIIDDCIIPEKKKYMKKWWNQYSQEWFDRTAPR